MQTDNAATIGEHRSATIRWDLTARPGGSVPRLNLRVAYLVNEYAIRVASDRQINKVKERKQSIWFEVYEME